ncbi:MAG: hypothetical protein Ctma_0949 [Catillopecten margaritatus gill symbiont]|uniref:Secreted protein n=1 Tax=Catillopecten margaritatus gill symbiont TaxID=3083288 RepID=A0AAU6PGW9_9GAMM
MKKIVILMALTLNFPAFALLGFGDDDASKGKEKTAKDCEIPLFAKAIGHEDKWLLHNGCPPRKDIEKENKEEK